MHRFGRLLWGMLFLAGLCNGFGAERATNTVPPDVFVVRRFEWMPAISGVRMSPVIFPRESPSVAVDHLAVLENHLWLTTRIRNARTNDNGPQLWALASTNGHLERVRGVLEKYHPRALWPMGRELWMAVEGGAGAFHAGSYAVEGFNALQGLASSNLMCFAEADGRLTTISDSGIVYQLDPHGTNWTRSGGPAPPLNPRSRDTWRLLAGSGRWLLAASANRLATRHILAPEWIDVTRAIADGTPWLDEISIHCIAGDDNGGFWVGTSVGLHHLQAESGVATHQIVPFNPGVSGAIVAPSGPWQKPSSAAYDQARERVITGIRTRMRDRARLARIGVETRRIVDPITPTSRIPGAVRAIARDKFFLWVATADGLNPSRSRILAFHLKTKRWLGWFAVGLPVRTLLSDDTHLWLGLDASNVPAGNTLIAVDKASVVAVPPKQWVPEELDPSEISAKLARPPVKEQAINAFFSGNHKKVAELLGNDPTTLDAEELFLLAFCHDAIGLDDTLKQQALLAQLHQTFPHSVFATSTRALLAPTTTKSDAVADPAETSADILIRRDLDSDGRINATELKLWLGDAWKLSDFDANGDGYLDASELPLLQKQIKAK
ncbi:MAG: hypothetical protein EXS36_18655 [Pedosphaera sp.]|nr:hypothetical protein [Pedosphaera sp.]